MTLVDYRLFLLFVLPAASLIVAVTVLVIRPGSEERLTRQHILIALASLGVGLASYALAADIISHSG